MSVYRAVFCDIDGTLLDMQYRLPEGNVRAVKNLVAAGTPFIMVSARMPDAMYAIQDALDVRAPMVCYGGALVLDRFRQPVHSIGINHDAAVDIKRCIAACRPDVATSVYSFGQWIVDDAAHPGTAREVEITGVTPLEGPVAEKLTPGNEVHKVFCIGEPADIDAVQADLLERFPNLAAHKSSPRYLEIMNKAVSKAAAVQFICRAMRIPVEESVAFGDNHNDLDMLKVVGLGVAMGNAPEEVKAGADKIAPDCNSEGVRVVLEELDFQPMSHSIRYERARGYGI